MNNFIDLISPIVKIKTDINGINLYVKRDDLLPFSFGGNKLRIAQEFLLDMYKNDCDCMICYGSSRSNLCRVIANICASLNIECHIVSPIDDKKETSNSILVKLFDAIVHKCEKSDVANTVEKVIEKCKQKGLKPYYIYGDKYGKGNESTPVNAYVKAFKEINNQAKDMDLKFDYIFCASGTGMTQAGLVIGNHLEKNNCNIVGISVARSKEQEIAILQEYINSYCKKNDIPTFKPEIIFEDKYLNGGYAQFSKEILNTIREAISLNGLPLDTTYTGKAFYGMKEYIKENSIKNKNILFIHTGGTPLFFDNMEFISNTIFYAKNKISFEKLSEFIKLSDSEFTPLLSSRINIEQFSKKLIDYSELFEAYVDDELVGLVAIYANDYESKKAYIPYVYCKKEYRKNGVAKQLLRNAINCVNGKNFEEIQLEVSTDNIPAIKLYKKYGFVELTDNENSTKTKMQLILLGGGKTP